MAKSMLENSKVILDTELCTKCKLCADECYYYYFDDENLYLDKEMDEGCIECGKCVAVCPVNAIRLKIHLEDKLKEIPNKNDLPSFKSLSNLFQKRRSIRQFKKDPVPKELVEKILDVAGRYSATGHNQQNVFFTIIQDRELLKKISDESTNQVQNLVNKYEDPEGRKSLERVFPKDLLMKVSEVIPSFKRVLKQISQGKERWRWDAELIILHSPKDALTLIENCTLAAGQIMLAAETLGLGMCSLGYLMEFLNTYRSLSKLAKIPRNHKVGYCLAMGYPKVNYHRIPARKPLKAKWM
jgi:nitroreductase/NAD-dependent dihydropyrimidine dehydrogenase PreA subunit